MAYFESNFSENKLMEIMPSKKIVTKNTKEKHTEPQHY